MKKSVDITPDISLIRKTGEVNYKIPDAIAELNDNAIDACLPGEKLTIKNTLGQKKGKKRILVVDNAAGMTGEEAAKALVMAHSGKRSGNTIGEFGLGLKTAASFLGGHFELITATQEAKKALRIVYDEDEFIRRGKWQIEIEEVDKPFDHGTSIEISQLKVNLYAGIKVPVMDRFSKIFKHRIGDEVEVLVNGTEVEPHVVETIPEYDTELDFKVGAKRVRGWVSLAPRGSSKGAYGFDLVRRNRVLAEHVKLGFKSGASLTRVVGELYLDEFPVVNNKTDFRRDTDDWDQLSKQMGKQLVDIVREARRLANPGAVLTPKDAVELGTHVRNVGAVLQSSELQSDIDRRALDAELETGFATGSLPFALPEDKEGLSAASEDGAAGFDDELSGADDPSSIQWYRLERVKTQLKNLAIEHEVARLGRDSLYKLWEVQGVGPHRRLLVMTNADHPMYTAMQDSFMVWMKHNIVEAVAEFFTEELGRTDAMLLTKSDILKHVGTLELTAADQDPEAELAPARETA